MIRAIVFVIIVILLIWGGVYYNNKSDRKQQEQAILDAKKEADAAAAMLAKLKIEDVVVGTGAEAKNGDTVEVNYVGTLDNGAKFDSSYDRKQPFDFQLGSGRVIKGWDLGILGMKVGGKRKLVIPPELAYGNQANGPIPANSTLHFTVEFLSVRGK